MKKAISLLLLSASLHSVSMAQLQVPFFGHIHWINGYAREISGENISYFSAYPDHATTALLTRCTDGNKAIEWETAPVPTQIRGKYVYFSWVAAHSSGTSSGNRDFDLYLDGQLLLTFTTRPAHQVPDWSFVGPDSSRLVFQQTKRDGANDAHGLAFLRLPLSKIRPGKPARLKIIGHAQQSNDWYMTFKFSFEEKVDVDPMPFILKSGGQPIVLTALHFGNDQRLDVEVDHTDKYAFMMKNGINTFDIPVHPMQKDDSVWIDVASGKNILVSRFVHLKPVLFRELHFIHHAHTDIGYSHMQPEVMRIHLKNIDDALRLIERTKNYPADARFKWNIESLWAVDHYLQQASPGQQDTFLAAVKDGSIGLSALYANILTGLSEPEEVFHYTDFAQQLRKKYGLIINSAMISDIPGYAWTTVTGLAKGGVKYFSSGPNFMGNDHPYGGDRVGHFVKTWGDRPAWWTSPSGEERILFWTAAKGYSSWHGMAPGAIFERGPRKIAAYLDELADKKYPYEMVQWRYNCVSDNGPIDTTLSDFVKQWNDKYSSPKIVLNTTEKLFESFEKKYGDSIPVVQGDITPYWEDGAISTAKEEGINRVNSLRLQQLSTLYSMLDFSRYDPRKFYQAWTNIILFHEHTWGAYNSTTEPDIPFVTGQWRIKKQFMLDAGDQVNALENELMQPLRDPRSKKIAVFNTSSWTRSGAVEIPATVSGRSVKDAAGKKMPLQKLGRGTYVFMAKEVPPLGTAFFEISDEAVTPAIPTFMLTDSSLSNGAIGFTWDKNNGSITDLNTGNDFNYAGTFNGQGLNSYWYVPGRDPAAAVTNGKVQVNVAEAGPVLTTISIRAEAPGADGLERRISLYAGSDEVLVENILDKQAVRSKEAVHFGYPFNTVLSKTTIDAGYGTLQFLTGQLPGSNMDYLYGRRWIDVSGAGKGLQWMLLEMPLLEPGSMIDERLTIQQHHKAWKKAGSSTATWFSYVMNNYWHTNYKADQEGLTRFRYALRPHGLTGAPDMERSAAAFTQPLIALPIKDDVLLPGQLFELSNDRIVVTGITPGEDGSYLVRLFNPENTVQQFKFSWKSLQPEKVIELSSGREKTRSGDLTMAAMGVAEFLLK